MQHIRIKNSQQKCRKSFKQKDVLWQVSKWLKYSILFIWCVCIWHIIAISEFYGFILLVFMLTGHYSEAKLHFDDYNDLHYLLSKFINCFLLELYDYMPVYTFLVSSLDVFKISIHGNIWLSEDVYIFLLHQFNPIVLDYPICQVYLLSLRVFWTGWHGIFFFQHNLYYQLQLKRFILSALWSYRI